MKSESEAQRLQKELDDLKNEFSDFVYTVSHDLGTPLRAIVNFSKLLKEKCEDSLDEDGKKFLYFITSGGEKAQAMMQGLLQYSRLNSRAKPPELTETSFIIDKCRNMLGDKIARCDGRLIIKGTMPAIMADSEQLSQLFLALLDNAFTYYQPATSPEVIISAEERDSHWKFIIKDNGIGVSPTNEKRVFELFKRLHTDEEYPGIGMGLTVAKRIVDRHGGSIGVDPSEKGGSIFWFTLPKRIEDSISQKERSFG